MRLWMLGLALCAATRLGADARADYMAAAEAQKAGHWDEAAQSYSKVTAQAPTYAPAWKQLATARYYLGDKEGAVASADRYLALQPSDSAFAAWADRLRAALKLPPRATPVPSPAPAAPVVPVAVAALAPAPAPVEELLGAAPPPGADAEIVAPEAAASINRQSSAAMAEVEQQSAQTEAEQMASEADAILRRREPARGRLQVGLRLLGGVALGLGSFEHGEEVDSASAPSAKAYNGKPAGGGSGAAELTLGFGSQVALSVGVYPIAWSDTRKSSQTTTVTRSNSSEASANFLPVMAGLGWTLPLTQSFRAQLAGSVGVIPSANVKVKSQTVQTYPASLEVTTVEASLDYNLAPAWRAYAGAEWALTKAWSFDLGLQALGATFGDAGGTATVTITDQSGALQYGTPVSVKVLPQPLSVLSLSLLAGLHVNF